MRDEALRLAASTGQVRLIRLLDTPTAHAAGLTAREIDVLRLISRGRSNRDIAAELRITENTAANHVRSILIKTGAAGQPVVALDAVRPAGDAGHVEDAAEVVMVHSAGRAAHAAPPFAGVK